VRRPPHGVTEIRCCDRRRAIRLDAPSTAARCFASSGPKSDGHHSGGRARCGAGGGHDLRRISRSAAGALIRGEDTFAPSTILARFGRKSRPAAAGGDHRRRGDDHQGVWRDPQPRASRSHGRREPQQPLRLSHIVLNRAGRAPNWMVAEMGMSTPGELSSSRSWAGRTRRCSPSSDPAIGVFGTSRSHRRSPRPDPAGSLHVVSGGNATIPRWRGSQSDDTELASSGYGS